MLSHSLPWLAPTGGTDVLASNPTPLSRKAATAMKAIAELHLVLNCPNEVALTNTIRSSSIINFPYPLELIRYYYRVHLVQNPCIICARSKMTKPQNYYLKPSIKRQLCIDVAWFLSHHGLLPMLVMIDTVEEFATIQELPPQYAGEDVLRCVIDRLKLDRSRSRLRRSSPIQNQPLGRLLSF